MKQVLVLVLVLGTGLVLFSQYTPRENSVLSTEEHAIALIKETHPEYQEYPSSTLAPKRIEVQATPDGWYVGMYVEGSGVPGILRANCFFVTPSGEIRETGLFQGEGPATGIDLTSCVPTE